jgi:hypothetical protein
VAFFLREEYRMEQEKRTGITEEEAISEVPETERTQNLLKERESNFKKNKPNRAYTHGRHTSNRLDVDLDRMPKSGGLTALQKHITGLKLGYPEMIKAMCCLCMGYYIDGRVDCEIPECPLYPKMPYRKR